MVLEFQYKDTKKHVDLLKAYDVHVIRVCAWCECGRLLSVTGVSVAFLTYFGFVGVYSVAWAYLQQQGFGKEMRHLWVLYGIITSTP